MPGNKAPHRPQDGVPSISSRADTASRIADEQRRLCRDWLVFLMQSSPEKTRTKADLRAEAMRRFGVSKGAFDFGWIAAIEDTGNYHWYEALRGMKPRSPPSSNI